jgi:CubicO group peptidase (beta-lactamase class C family)
MFCVRMAWFFALLGALFLLLTDVSVAAPLNEVQVKSVNSAAQKQLTRLLSNRKSAGAAFALIDEGRVVLLSANGVRAREANKSGNQVLLPKTALVWTRLCRLGRLRV